MRRLVQGSSLLLLLGIVGIVVGGVSGHPVRAEVLYEDGKYTLQVTSSSSNTKSFWAPEHRSSRVAAKAEYSEDAEHSSGFGTMRVWSNGQMDDLVQAFAAGYIEGALSSTRIFQHYNNMKHICVDRLTGEVPLAITDYFKRQRAWTEQQVAEAPPACPRWRTIAAGLAQLDGLLQGYNEHSKEGALDRWALDLLNGLGDLFDIKPAVLQESRPCFENMSREELDLYMFTNSHCSAIIKVTEDLSDILVGHSSWFSYSSQLRIFKLYELNFKGMALGSSRTAFSSYPGVLTSLDDFYMMQDSKLVMVQTTNPVLNVSLWDLVVPESLLAWQRVKMANTLAHNVSQWLDLVSMHNSGTYNNQYMVVDFKLFVPGQALPPGTLTVVEQIPGLVVGADLTDQLERAYFPSFNVPYFTQVYRESGFPRLDRLARRTEGSEYQMAPRASIFRRDHNTVHDIEGLKKILRYNDYEHDPLSQGSPLNSICSRGDLVPGKPHYSGCYDTKVTNRELFLKGSSQAWIINGPTSQGQPVFRWSDVTAAGGEEEDDAAAPPPPHEGQPDAFDFTFELISMLN